MLLKWDDVGARGAGIRGPTKALDDITIGGRFVFDSFDTGKQNKHKVLGQVFAVLLRLALEVSKPMNEAGIEFDN
jgi:hypothetical protein